jgi:galactokinase
VPAAAAAFEAGNAATFGDTVARSHAGAERFLGNQVPETIGLAASARALGAIAASAFGAGFGGSVWALVPAGQADGFRSSWEKDYRRRFPAAASSGEFFVTRAGPGLLRLQEG